MNFTLTAVTYYKSANCSITLCLLPPVVLLMYLPVAISGYIIYGAQASDNILESMSPGPMLYIVEVLITLHLFCSFIIVINPVCQETEELLRIPIRN